MLLRAEDALIEYGKSPAKTSNRKVAIALKKHFNWTPAVLDLPLECGKLNDVPGKVLDVVGTLLGKQQGGITVPPEAICSHNDQQTERIHAKFPGDITTIAASALEDNTNCFMYTRKYFSSTPEFRAKVIVHEMCHSWGIMTDDPFYEGHDGYPGDFRVAMRNPDSFAGLIRDIGRHQK
jgi:hypothetical protein